MNGPGYTDDLLAFIAKLEQLADYSGQRADDEFRDLIGEIQDEFENMQRARAREDERVDSRLGSDVVYGFATDVEPDFPRAAAGARLFVQVAAVEKGSTAQNN